MLLLFWLSLATLAVFILFLGAKFLSCFLADIVFVIETIFWFFIAICAVAIFGQVIYYFVIGEAFESIFTLIACAVILGIASSVKPFVGRVLNLFDGVFAFISTIFGKIGDLLGRCVNVLLKKIYTRADEV